MTRSEALTQAIAYANEQMATMTNYELLSFCFDRLVDEEVARLAPEASNEHH
jgi:hypothetical protein